MGRWSAGGGMGWVRAAEYYTGSIHLKNKTEWMKP
jgi:hypothetical protein